MHGTPIVGGGIALEQQRAWPPVDQAVADWRRAIGTDWVDTDPALLGSATCRTYAAAPSPVAIVRPADADQVSACIGIALRHGVAIHPVSTGLNWGYGSSSPPAAGAAVLHLGRLSRILNYDPRLGTVDLEPGVTQGQLARFLDEQGGLHWLDATGASPDASVVGTALERGFGHTPFADRWAHVCNLHVVLADGSRIQTGFGAMPGSRAAACHRWGAGPDLDGLFVQSGLGIVTRLTLWLMPAPACMESFYFSCRRDDDLLPVIDALRPLRIDGTIRSAMHIANPWKAIAAAAPELGGRGLTRDQLLAAARRMGLGAWNGSGCITGSAGQVAEARSQIRTALRGRVDRLVFLGEARLKWAQRLAKPLGALLGTDLERILSLVMPVHRLMRGQPSHVHQRSVWWGKPGDPPERVDPDASRCGLMWWSPVVPLDGDQVLVAARTAVATLAEGGFMPQVVVNVPYPRAALVLATIAYDRDRAGDDARAEACLHRLRERFDALGYHPYRYGIQGVGHWRRSLDPDYARIIDRLAEALDPHGILGQRLMRGTGPAFRDAPDGPGRA